MIQALGIIESRGLASAIEAADTAVKAANVKLIGYEKLNGGGLIAVKIRGDVGAVKAAVAAAREAASHVCEVSATLVIPRPDIETDKVIFKENIYCPQVDPDDSPETDLNYTDVPETDVSEDESEEEILTGLEEDDQVVSSIEPGDEEELNEPKGEEEVNEPECEESDVCNLCKDPACPRRKGQPHTMCIHYMK